MGCDYHQFFTKNDVLNKKLTFIDAFDDVIEDDKVESLALTCASKVDVDYVFVCTIESSIDVFNYFPLERARRLIDKLPDLDGKYTKSKYLKDIAESFSKINFCSDAEYSKGFATKFENGIWFPECCRKELMLMKKAYDNVKSLEMLLAEIDRLSKIVSEKCKNLVKTVSFINQEFYDLEYSSSYISVYPKHGQDAMVIKLTTC